jgi:hypothetical protein
MKTQKRRVDILESKAFEKKKPATVKKNNNVNLYISWKMGCDNKSYSIFFTLHSPGFVSSKSLLL